MHKRFWTLLLVAGCASDGGLTAPGGTEAPVIGWVQPAPESTVFVGDVMVLEVELSDPDGPLEALSLVWASSATGLLSETLSVDAARQRIEVEVPDQVGTLELVALARDGRGGAARAGIPVQVVDPDRDGDGHRAPAYGGADCDDQNPQVHPDAAERCDGFDQNCDGVADEGLPLSTWFQDEDGDGAGNPRVTLEACAQPAGFVADALDCHDDEPERSHCFDCADLRSSIWDTGDGVYTIDPVGGAPFSTVCDMSTGEGGWTLVAVTTWDSTSWNHLTMMDTVPFGPEASLDTAHKSPGFMAVPVQQLRFDNGVMSAQYTLTTGPSYASMWHFLDGIPMHNCGEDEGYNWPMDEGTLANPRLCSTDLYVNVRDTEGNACTTDWIPQNVSMTGPGWSMVFNGRCPHDDSMQSGWIGDGNSGYGGGDPWGPEHALRMWVRGVWP